MADTSKQKALLAALSEHFKNSTQFTLEELRVATGWPQGTFDTYRSKQFGSLIDKTASGKYRVTETFRRYSDWSSFRDLVSQKRNTVAATYDIQGYDNPVVFEFFLPLANEVLLRDTLDSLFYSDTILAKLETKSEADLISYWPIPKNTVKEKYLENLCAWLGKKFAGYSIGSVNGRFRALPFCTQEVAAQNKAKYLIDETTATVRFIFPIERGEDVEAIRYFFRILFVQSIVEVVNKEAAIWMLESGARNHLHIWTREEIID
jgi:hypothetical protein